MITPYDYEVPTLIVVHTKPRHPIQVHIKQNTGVCMTALLNSKGTDHQHQVTPSTANALSHVHIIYCAEQNSGRKNLW